VDEIRQLHVELCATCNCQISFFPPRRFGALECSTGGREILQPAAVLIADKIKLKQFAPGTEKPMSTQAEENYLKEIYTLELDHPQVSTSMLAERFGFSAATVTGMLKKLSRAGWVVYEPYQGVTLSPSGRAIALEVIRRHRLIETFLTRILNVPWDRVHAEAEQLEHVISEYLEERIDEVLNHPRNDPHGSPIPSDEGDPRAQIRLPLAALPVGAKVEILEVYDRDSQLLAHLDQMHLRPQTQLTVTAIEPLDGLITIQVNGQSHILGPTTARQIFVRLLGLDPE
jgi:DtxR family Mn-dependent transcriptional regulator